jgi:PAS domain S-box-containing protein
VIPPPGGPAAGPASEPGHALTPRRLLDASADGLVHVAATGRVLDANRTMSRLLGRPPSLVVGSSFADWFAERDQAAKGLDLAADLGRMTDYALTLVVSDGRLLPVSLNAVTLPDGDAAGILVSVRDVTDQHELERQLRDAIEHARSLIESNRDVLVTTDDAGRITDLNRQMELLVGRGRTELTGTALAALFAEPAAAARMVEDTLRDGVVSDVELTIGDHQTTVACNAAILRDRHGAAAGLIVTARDMTERKRLEQALRAANVELELANLGKDRFLAAMSHELRTPLNGIMGFTDILLAEMPGPLNEEQREHLGVVRTSARHLLSIINDLLDLARIEEGRWEGDFRPTDCREVAEHVAAGLVPLAREKGLELRVDCPDDGLVALVDRRTLAQVLVNLLGNAIKFTERGGVRLVLSRRDGPGTPTIAFEVVDSGIGIGREDQERLFLAFERAGQAGGPREGTGLGLHISRRLAGNMGGTITVESELGSGSRFVLELPRDGPKPRR